MIFSAWITLIFSFLVLVGGIMGHVKAQSRMSLFAGLIFGLLLLLSSLALFKGMKIGAYGAITLSALLLCFFGWRYLTTFKLFPPLIMALLSLAVLFLLILHIFWRQPPN